MEILALTLKKIEQANTLEALEDLRHGFMGKSGTLTAAMRALGKLTGDARKEEGARLNDIKLRFLDTWRYKKEQLEQTELEKICRKQALDLTLFPRHRDTHTGHVHVLYASLNRMVTLLRTMGFQLKEGPEIETQDLNFDALNIPIHHPARAEHDTLYLKDVPYVLRTHTSPVQVRATRSCGAPLRIISAGRVFRDDYDATHTPMFHQIEGLVIEPGLHMGHLKACLTTFLEAFFECSLTMRFRPNYFPFTEPSAEVDIFAPTLHGGQWLEVLGCGMVHPHVLRAMGLDPAHHQGFAFGMGVERLTMLKEKLTDLRTFFAADKRWTRATGKHPSALA